MKKTDLPMISEILVATSAFSGLFIALLSLSDFILLAISGNKPSILEIALPYFTFYGIMMTAGLLLSTGICSLVGRMLNKNGDIHPMFQ